MCHDLVHTIHRHVESAIQMLVRVSNSLSTMVDSVSGIVNLLEEPSSCVVTMATV